jgi:WD40 repeat protein
MMAFAPTRSSNLELPANSYIYKIITTAPREDALIYQKADQLAVISSDDSLRFFDPTTLQILPDGIIQNVNDKVTCLERGNDLPSNLVATAGRDGLVKYWDNRSRQKVAEIQSREESPRHG